MKKVLFFLILLVTTFLAQAQKMPKDYMDEAAIANQHKQYQKALESYQYIVVNHAKSKYYPQALLQIADIYVVQEKEAKAVLNYQQIIAMKIPLSIHARFRLANIYKKADKIEQAIETMQSVLIDSMSHVPTPRTRRFRQFGYKNEACLYLIDLYEQQGKYNQALHYLVMADTVYQYEAGCGQELVEVHTMYALKYADIYQNLGRDQEAMQYIFPLIFSPFIDFETVAPVLKELLPSGKDLIVRLDQSIDNLQQKDDEFYLHFLGYSFPCDIEIVDLQDDVPYVDQLKMELRKTDFYKLVATIDAKK